MKRFFIIGGNMKKNLSFFSENLYRKSNGVVFYLFGRIFYDVGEIILRKCIFRTVWRNLGNRLKWSFLIIHMNIFSISQNLFSGNRGNFFFDISSKQILCETDSFFYGLDTNIFYFFQTGLKRNMIDILNLKSRTYIHLQNNRSESIVEYDIASNESYLRNFLYLNCKLEYIVPMRNLHTTHITNSR